MSIHAKYDSDHGEWLGFHSESPIMVVSGNTEEIVRDIVRKNLVWYHERQVKKREQEVLNALASVIQFGRESELVEDTAPSEMSIYEEPNQGC